MLFVLKDIWTSSTNCSTTETRRFSKPAAGIWPTGICTAWASRDWRTCSVFRYWDASHSALKQGAVKCTQNGGCLRRGFKGTFCPFSTHSISDMMLISMENVFAKSHWLKLVALQIENVYGKILQAEASVFRMFCL